MNLGKKSNSAIKTMKRHFRDYQEQLLEALQDKEETVAYLQAASIDEDPHIFLLALKNVVTAQKAI